MTDYSKIATVIIRLLAIIFIGYPVINTVFEVVFLFVMPGSVAIVAWRWAGLGMTLLFFSKQIATFATRGL